MKRYFPFLLLALALLGIFIRLYILRGDNLFFTVDQGRDAIYIREILHGKIFLKGPETNIRGIFAGPLIYYFFALGYILSGGHPIGSVLTLIFLNVLLTIGIVIWLRPRVGEVYALLVGLLLTLFWSFFETSLWGFNPFTLPAIAFLLIVFLMKFLDGKTKYYFCGLVPIGLAYNSEIAGATALFLLYILVGIHGVRKKLVPAKKFLTIVVILPLIGALILAKQFISQLFSGSPTSGQSGGQVFGSTDFIGVGKEFINIIGSVFIPQSIIFGLLLFIVSVGLFYKFRKHINKSLVRFGVLVLMLTAISYVFFSLTKGYRTWHTVYLAPLIFVSVISLLTQIPRKFGIPLLVILTVFQVCNFKAKYSEYRAPNSNPSLLYNEKSAIDWIYSKSPDLGFKVYNYTDTFYDYPYQYLFYWYALPKYGYLPEEYSNYPLTPKELYVPGSMKYIEPKRSGEGISFIIIQSETNGEDNADWMVKFRKYFTLIDETTIGGITIEKHQRNNGAPNDPCIWWERCPGS